MQAIWESENSDSRPICGFLCFGATVKIHDFSLLRKYIRTRLCVQNTKKRFTTTKVAPMAFDTGVHIREAASNQILGKPDK